MRTLPGKGFCLDHINPNLPLTAQPFQRSATEYLTASFENFDFVIEAFDKAAGLPTNKVVRYFIEPVLQCCQEALKAIEPAAANTPHPTFDSRCTRLFCVISFKDGGQLLAQIIGLLQIWRAFKKQR